MNQLNTSTRPFPRQSVSTAKTWVRIISVTLVALGVSVLVGWAFDITFLKSILPGLSPMKPNTAVSFLLIGLGVWLIQSGNSNTTNRVAQITTWLVFLIGSLTLAEYLFGWNLGIDNLLLGDHLLTAGGSPLGRMSEASAVGFTLLGLSLILLLYTRRYRLAQFFALLVLGIGLLAFAGYLFSVSELYAVSAFNVIALHSTLAFCASALLILLISAQEGFIAVITQKNLGGVMARRLLPATFLVPLTIGWVRLQGQYLGYYGTEFGLALFAVSDIIILTIVVWWTARVLNKIDVEHQRATTQLQRYGQRMEILHQIDQGIITSMPILELMTETIKQLRILIPCQRIAIGLVDESNHELVIYVVDTDRDNPFVTTRLPLVPQIFEGFSADNTRIYEDLRLVQHLPFMKNLVEQGFLTHLQVLLIQDGHPLGIMGLSSVTLGFFTSEHREIAMEVANQLAIVINQMRMSESIQKANGTLERYARRMEILHNIDRGIIASLDTAEIAVSTFKELRILIPCQRISLKLVDGATRELVVYAADSVNNPLRINRIPFLPEMLEGFDEHHTRLIDDLRLVPHQVPLAEEYLTQGFHTLFQILLVQSGVIEGIVTLASDTPDFFTPEYREIAIEVSDQLAIAIQQMRLSEALQSANEKLEQRVIERTAQLNASKEQVEGILNSSLDAILLTDDKLAIQRVNPAYERLLSSPSDGYIGQSLLDIIHEDDIPKLTNSVQNALSGRNISEIEVRALRSDGSSVEVELNLGNIEGDGFVSNIHDITTRKQFERQMLYHAGIQNAVADAVIVTDLEYRIQDWNKAAERMYGWREDEVIGELVQSLLQTEFYSQQTVDDVLELFTEKGYWSDEVTQHRKDGSLIYILSSTALMKDADGTPFGVLAVNHDITQRKQAEQAVHTALTHEKEVGEMKTRFISIASHEFRTPLTAILLTTETLKHYRHKLASEEIDLKLDKIEQQVKHMTAILEDVMHSARMQDNRVDFKPSQGNLDAVCSDIVQEFAQRPEFTYRIQYTSDIQNRVLRFDSRLMRQIIINVLSNALKYSPGDKPVQVKLTQKDQNIVLEISDQGIGIPQADLKHIFEPFHRAENVGDISGTGLGMSITKKAVEMHDGNISLTSEPNVGTTFTVTIPIR